MDIILFLAGFLTGAILVAVIFTVVNSKGKNSTDALMKQMELYFENTANKIFEESSAKFSNTNKEKLDDFFSKFKEKIEDFEKRTNEKFKNEDENFIKFDQNIRQFIEAGSKIAQDTSNLTQIMKSDNRTQGQWGEIVLEHVLEASGLRKDDEYFIQKADTVEGRPDAIVKLPENKCVMIDAKTSLASFSAYLQAESEEEKLQHLKEFKDSTKSHIAGLTKRDYKPSDESLSPEYILMFIPIESCYSLMFCDDNYLWDLAWKNHIMPVSPSTLLASLKIINAFLVVNRQNENAQEISRLATKMLDKFSDMVKNIRQAREKIDTGLKQLDGRDSIIVNAEKMTELGAKINKPLPEPENRDEE
ncbi:MAG: hypothetical protein DKM23_03365 [Candidatus Melainabacteria bacterium]|nr:MAG: hypothetical protein DKM24_04290 [Candidatus Melainabacteria bacterium]RAI12556.1 MAG: hypothetical protein DKM23_03365 [Candidatus Melainabacteria bacterium]